MDGPSFDRLTRTLGRATSRRAALAAAIGAGLAGVAALGGGRAGAGQGTCQEEGAGCGLLIGCCAGLVCVRLPFNPNAGVCRAATSGTQPTATANPTPTPGSGLLPPNTGGVTATGTATVAPTTPPLATVPPTATPTPTPVPTRLSQVRLVAGCGAAIDTLTIDNSGQTAIQIERIRTDSADPSFNQRSIPVPDSIQRLEAGQTLVLSFGPRGSRLPNRLREHDLFKDGELGVVRVETSVGLLRAPCEGS